MVVDAAGALLAWGLVWDHNRTDHQDVDVYSSPALGSETVRGALLDWLVARLGQRARAAGYERIVADAGCYHDDARYAATLRSRGLAHVRTFHRLRIDLQRRACCPDRRVRGSHPVRREGLTRLAWWFPGPVGPWASGGTLAWAPESGVTRKGGGSWVPSPIR